MKSERERERERGRERERERETIYTEYCLVCAVLVCSFFCCTCDFFCGCEADVLTVRSLGFRELEVFGFLMHDFFWIGVRGLGIRV